MAKESVINLKQTNSNGSAAKELEKCHVSVTDAQHDIEEVYQIIGLGRVHWIVLLASGFNLLMVINETQGMSIITLASKCDLKTSSVDQAVMNSAGIMGIVCTSYFWGYLSDIIGRRKILVYTTLTGNLLSLISIFIPTYWPFVIFRLLNGFFISGAASLTYSYMGEFLSSYHRPIVMNYGCMFVGISLFYFPVVAWLILSMDWSLNISDEFSFRPWRLILLLYFFPGFIAAIILIILPETPMFLLSKNKQDEAYTAVDWICRHSKGKTLADLNIFKIKPEMQLKKENLLVTIKSSNILVEMWKETRPLFQRPHVISLIISSIVMMGLFMNTTGMGLWYPTIQNRVGLSENSEEPQSVCELLEAKEVINHNASLVSVQLCDDTINSKTFIDSTIVGAACVVGYLLVGMVIRPFGRKNLLIASLAIPSVLLFSLLWVKVPIAIVVNFVIYLALPTVTISALGSAVVDLVPTHLRAKGVCIVFMIGRSGSVIGSYILGVLLDTQCMGTFSFYSAFGLVCAASVLFLPI